MTEERFKILAEAYGGDIAGWPVEERAAAAALIAARPALAQDVLAAARSLDAALDDWRSVPASAALIDRIVAGAPAPRRAPRWRGWLMPAGLGAGLAAAGVAGLLVGVQLSQQVVTGADNVAAVVAALDPTTVAEDV